MISENAYDTTVMVFKRYLQNAIDLLLKVQTQIKEQLINEQELLRTSLCDGMFGLADQVMIAAHFSNRAFRTILTPNQLQLCHAQMPMQSMNDLIVMLKQRLSILEGLDPNWVNQSAQTLSADQAGDAQVSLPLIDLVTQYALPNFSFHLTMAYAILRQQGFDIGKSDFDGFHQYQTGFRWV